MSPTKKTRKPAITEAERDRIAERHSGLVQDALPGMPERPEQPPKKKRGAPSGPVWRRVKSGAKMATRVPVCGDCIREIQLDGSSPARRVVWRRAHEGKTLELCAFHAEPIKAADEAARPKKKRRRRNWHR